jgi:phosphocarrier protein HPr
MLEGTIKVVNPLGLHARAAAQLVRVASRFRSKIIIEKADGSVEANAKSILSVLMLAATVGSELVLKAEGADEKEAFTAISDLFDIGFGEL